jgi:hypothetical protein
MKTIISTMVITLILSQPVAALTGKQLLESCSRYSDEFHTGLCFGYLDGAMNVLLLDNNAGDFLPNKFCLPEELEIKELRQVTMEQLKNSPMMLDKAGFTAVLNALLNNYPCR